MTRLLIGLALIPAALASLSSAARVVSDAALQARTALPFMAGFLAYPVLYAGLFAPHSRWAPTLVTLFPIRAYVLGHELSHAFAAWLSGARVTGFFVSHKGGHVDLSHTNSFIALAPYFLPIYAAAAALAYRLLVGLGAVPAGWETFVYHGFLGLMGLSLSFHLIHTGEALWMEKQPDLRQGGGVVFSLAVIALANGIVVVLLMKCLFPNAVSVTQAAEAMAHATIASVGYAWRTVLSVFR